MKKFRLNITAVGLTVIGSVCHGSDTVNVEEPSYGVPIFSEVTVPTYKSEDGSTSRYTTFLTDGSVDIRDLRVFEIQKETGSEKTVEFSATDSEACKNDPNCTIVVINGVPFFLGGGGGVFMKDFTQTVIINGKGELKKSGAAVIINSNKMNSIVTNTPYSAK